jgi:hypothetical protein
MQGLDPSSDFVLLEDDEKRRRRARKDGNGRKNLDFYYR